MKSIRYVTMFALLSFSCSDDVVPPANNNVPDMSVDVAEDIPPQIICEPGEIVECGQENSPATRVCNSEGTAVESGSCPTSPLSVCRGGTCEEVTCIPGTRRCENVAQAQICNEAGSAFENSEQCTGSSRCEEGNCLSRCRLAELTNSYIGCEYWAVELENHLLSDSRSNPLPPDRRPPFAIVLFNPSETYDARVSVFSEPNVHAEAIGSRIVGTDIPLPGIELVTVESRVLGPRGQELFKIEGPINSIVLPRGSMMTLIMPFREIPFGSTSLTQTAYRVSSTQPVVAYQFNPLCCNYNYTNDASLLLPTSALTENYLFMSYAVWAGTASARLAEPYSSTMTILATQPDTSVTVQLPPPKGANRPHSQTIYPPNNARISGPDANGRLTVVLQPHEVLNVAGSGAGPVEDMTGARITASKPISVFGGHTCAFVPFGNPACDHLESQLFPIETWGTKFVAAPLKLRRKEGDPVATREGTYWKFLAVSDNTTIQTGISLGAPVSLPPADEGVAPCRDFSTDIESGTFTLNAGQTCEFGTSVPFVVQAGQPIMIGAFLSGQNSVKVDAQFGDHAGDPAFFLVPPEEQYRSEYSFLTPATYFQSYVTVVIRPGFNVTLDGLELDVTQFDYEVIAGGEMARIHIPVEDGPHSIEAQIPFGIIVYGYDDYVSYAYTGGLDLAKLNTF